MFNVFGGSLANRPGNIQVVKKVVVTVAKFKDYSDEIQQSYVLRFTHYRLHKNVDGTFVTPIRVYDGKVCILDDVVTMEVGNRYLTMDTIRRKLVYFMKDHGSSGDIVALQGDRRPSRSKRFESQCPTGKCGVEGPECPPGNICKMGPVGSRG